MNRLKETNPLPVAETLNATAIKNKALNEIKSFAFYEAELLYKLIYGDTPNYEDEEELCICTGDLKRKVFVNVMTYNPYLDIEETTYEHREMAEIIVQTDNTIIVRDENGDEWNDWELTFDEIVNIVDAIQEAYNAKIKK